MDKENKRNADSEEVRFTGENQEGVRYYQVNSAKSSSSHGVRNALIIIAGILAAVVLLGVSCTQMANSIIGTLGLSGASYSEKEISLPSHDYVAQVSVEGSIQSGNQDYLGMAYGYQHGWTLELLKELAEDPNNKGILLWVNSPGGTIYESDELYLALKEYKEVTGRPMYAAMGNMAASGGYYISAACDEIWANRNTWTGSIGVTLGTFIDVSGLLEEYGVKTTTITSGKNKAMGSEFQPMSQEQLAIFQGLVDEAYEQFVGVVSENRNMEKDQVIALADGRIYTAAQALEIGLIDFIGTKEAAYEALQQTHQLETVALEEFYYARAPWFFGLVQGLTKAIESGSKGDLAALKEMLETNDQIQPMYLYEGGR
jgi:protease-4